MPATSIVCSPFLSPSDDPDVGVAVETMAGERDRLAFAARPQGRRAPSTAPPPGGRLRLPERRAPAPLPSIGPDAAAAAAFPGEGHREAQRLAGGGGGRGRAGRGAR